MQKKLQFQREHRREWDFYLLKTLQILAVEMPQQGGVADEAYFFKSKSSIDYRYDIEG